MERRVHLLQVLELLHGQTNNQQALVYKGLIVQT